MDQYDYSLPYPPESYCRHRPGIASCQPCKRAYRLRQLLNMIEAAQRAAGCYLPIKYLERLDFEQES